jgi:hypothetical protein
MRGSALIWITVALAAGACSQKEQKPPAAPPAAVAQPAPPAPAPAPETAPLPTTPSAVEAPPPGAPAAPEVVRFSPADYPAKERRITALINNAESRDTTGETQSIAGQGRAQRQHCTTKACIDRSYAAEEARLRKWEGSGDIK